MPLKESREREHRKERKERWETGAGNAERRKQSRERERQIGQRQAAEAGKGREGEEGRLVAWRGHTSRGLCCVCVFLVLACLHMLWATARLGSARAAAAATTAAAVAAVSNLCAIETYEMQKCSPEKQQQQQIKHEAQQ